MSGCTLPVEGACSGAESPRLEIRLFGQMEVRVGGSALPRLRSRKGLWLLALLSLRSGRDVERGWLAGTLWPDSDEENARRSLRQTLHDLRLALGAEAWRLSSESPRALRLDISGAFLDVLDFDLAAGLGDRASSLQCVRLYRGSLLEDCAEEWVIEPRRRHELAYIAALQRLAAAASARRDYEGAIDYLRLAIATDPFDEGLQRALMQAMADSGDLAGALLVYREYRDLAWREISAGPSDATDALFRRLRDEAHRTARGRAQSDSIGVSARAQSPPRTPRARRTPAALTELIGRDEAAQEVLFLLMRARLVTLTGSGGVGKTSLALRVAELLNEEYEDGAAFVDLSAVAEPEMIPTAVRDSLGLPPGDARLEAAEALRDYLAARQTLLVLDNCEHLLAGCAALANRLLRECPGLRILATSRHALGTQGETVWRVPSLELPPVRALAPFDRADGQSPSPANYAAVRLFVERARAAESSFQMTLYNAPAIVAICRRLDGIPLAIELAAARVRSLPVEEISARLHKGFGLLAAGGASLLPRHKTLEAAFDWSWELLTEPEKLVLQRLSTFAGGWSLAAAEEVCSGDGVDPGQVVVLLGSLVDKSLVVYRPPGSEGERRISGEGQPRYRLLETVRQFASERLQASGTREAALDRHRDYYLEWAEGIKALLHRPEQSLWFARLEADHDNLRAALEWCRMRGDVEKEFRLAVALSRFWDTHGHLPEGLAHLNAALSRMAPELPLELCTAALVCAGWSASAQGDYAASREFYGRALELYRQSGDQTHAASVLNYLACVLLKEGDFAEAERLFKEALAILRTLGPSGALASVLNNLGDLVLRRGDLAAARSLLTEAASHCRSAGQNDQLLGIIIGNLAIAALREGRRSDAQEHAAESLRLFSALGAVVEVPDTIDTLGVLAASRGDMERAACLFGAAAGLAAALSTSPSGFVEADRGRAIAAARSALGDEAYGEAFLCGKAFDLDRAVAYALDPPSAPD